MGIALKIIILSNNAQDVLILLTQLVDMMTFSSLQK